MEVLPDLLGEPFVEDFVSVEHKPLPQGAFLVLGHQGGGPVLLEQPRHLAVGPQRVHPIKEAGSHPISLVDDGADLLVLTAGLDECSLASSGPSYEQGVVLGLADDPVYPEPVAQHLVE